MRITVRRYTLGSFVDIAARDYLRGLFITIGFRFISITGNRSYTLSPAARIFLLTSTNSDVIRFSGAEC